MRLPTPYSMTIDLSPKAPTYALATTVDFYFSRLNAILSLDEDGNVRQAYYGDREVCSALLPARVSA
jgi:hypothetical protein